MGNLYSNEIKDRELWNCEDSIISISDREDNKQKLFTAYTQGQGETMFEGAISSVSADVSGSVMENNLGPEKLKFINAYLGGDLTVANGVLGAQVKAGVDLFRYENKAIKIRAGLNLDTGISIGKSGSAEAKIAGVGIKVGRELGISLGYCELETKIEQIVPSNCITQ